MTLDRVDPIVSRIWGFKRELVARWFLGQTLPMPDSPKGKPIKGVSEKPFKMVNGGYDYRIRVNYQGISTAGRADQTDTYAMALPTLYDYAIFRPRMTQAYVTIGDQDVAQIDGDSVADSEKQMDLTLDSLDIALESLVRETERMILGYGFTHNALAGLPIAGTTSGRVSVQGLGMLLDDANKSGMTGNEGMYGYIDRSDAAYADWKAVKVQSTNPLTENSMNAVWRRVRYGGQMPTVILVSEAVNAIIWGLGPTKVRFLNDAPWAFGTSAMLTFNGCPILEIKTMDDAVFGDAEGTPGVPLAKFYKTTNVLPADAGSTPVGDLDILIQQGILMINENTIKIRGWRKMCSQGGGPKKKALLDAQDRAHVIGRYQHLWTMGCTNPKLNGVGHTTIA
jgi:hypothetical protein